jgi:hypothetical protein
MDRDGGPALSSALHTDKRIAVLEFGAALVSTHALGKRFKNGFRHHRYEDRASDGPTSPSQGEDARRQWLRGG